MLKDYSGSDKNEFEAYWMADRPDVFYGKKRLYEDLVKKDEAQIYDFEMDFASIRNLKPEKIEEIKSKYKNYVLDENGEVVKKNEDQSEEDSEWEDENNDANDLFKVKDQKNDP